MSALSLRSGLFTLASLCLGMILLGCADPNADKSSQSAAAIDLSVWPGLQSGEKEEVMQCLQGSAVFEDLHPLGNTPLHCAAWIGAADVIATLLDAGADVHAINDEGESPLHYAIKGSMFKKVQAGIHLGRFSRHSRGATRAEAAIEGTYAPIISLLANAGADLNLHNEFGLTPLHLALAPCQYELIQALVNAGADVHIPRRKYSETHTPLHTAAWQGCSEAIPRLITAGAMVNSQEMYSTPLHYAVEYSEDPETVTALLRHGANVNAIGGYADSTPLDLALWVKNVYVEFLAEEPEEGYRRRIEKQVADYETIISMLAAAGGKTSESLLEEREAGAAEEQ